MREIQIEEEQLCWRACGAVDRRDPDRAEGEARRRYLEVTMGTSSRTMQTLPTETVLGGRL